MGRLVLQMDIALNNLKLLRTTEWINNKFINRYINKHNIKSNILWREEYVQVIHNKIFILDILSNNVKHFNHFININKNLIMNKNNISKLDFADAIKKKNDRIKAQVLLLLKKNHITINDLQQYIHKYKKDNSILYLCMFWKKKKNCINYNLLSDIVLLENFFKEPILMTSGEHIMETIKQKKDSLYVKK